MRSPWVWIWNRFSTGIGGGEFRFRRVALPPGACENAKDWSGRAFASQACAAKLATGCPVIPAFSLWGGGDAIGRTASLPDVAVAIRRETSTTGCATAVEVSGLATRVRSPVSA
jgi:hypothetical protein